MDKTTETELICHPPLASEQHSQANVRNLGSDIQRLRTIWWGPETNLAAKMHQKITKEKNWSRPLWEIWEMIGCVRFGVGAGNNGWGPKPKILQKKMIICVNKRGSSSQLTRLLIHSAAACKRCSVCKYIWNCEPLSACYKPPWHMCEGSAPLFHASFQVALNCLRVKFLLKTDHGYANF